MARGVVNVHATYGALLLGGLVASMYDWSILPIWFPIQTSSRLNGLVVLQIIIYFKTYEGDHKKTKALVCPSSGLFAWSDQIPLGGSHFVSPQLDCAQDTVIVTVASILDYFNTVLLWASLWDYIVTNINNITHIHEIYW